MALSVTAVNNKQAPRSTVFFVTVSAAVLLLAAAYAFLLAPGKQAEPVYLNDFRLTMHDGSAFTAADILGKWNIIFFGYMNCPDVCPATMLQLKEFYGQLKLSDRSESLPQVIFISVDSGRDRPELIADYVKYFDKSFIGATGSREQLISFTGKLDAFFRIDAPGRDNRYDVVHTADIFVIDPEGRLVERVSPPFDINALVNQFGRLTRSGEALAVNSPVQLSGFGIR